MAQSIIKTPFSIGATGIYFRGQDTNGTLRQLVAGSTGVFQEYYDTEAAAWKTNPNAINRGGTGATTAAGAVTNLGIGEAFIERDVTISITTAASSTDSNLSGTAPSVSGYTPYFFQGWNMTGTASSMLMISRLKLTPSTRKVEVQVRNTSTNAANATMTVQVGYIKNTLL